MRSTFDVRAILIPGSVVLVATLSGGVAAQSLVDLPALLREVAEPKADPLTLVTHQAELSLEPLSEPLSVTDEELLAAGSIVAVPTSIGPTPFVVDDDLAQCPDATFTTATGIQQAILAAPPGSLIRVCPGLYTPIVVNKDALDLEAPRHHGRASQCQAPLVPDPTQEAIIDAGNSAVIAVTVAANNVTLLGFTVQNTTGNPGIYTLPTFSGHHLRFNVVQQNTFGLYLNSSGTFPTVVDHNCFRFNNRPGSASGDGIYSDQGLRNATVEHNSFTGNNVAAMVFALNQQNIVIEHNDMEQDAGTVVLVDAQNVRAAYNLTRNTTSSAYFVGGGVTSARLEFNRVSDIGGTGFVVNTQFLNAPNQLVIEKNHVQGGPFDGIRLTNTDNSAVLGNRVERVARDGLRLQATADNNRVAHNLSRGNGRDGLRIETQSSANTVEQNKMHDNVEHDCHDDTFGPGTSGTANFWIKNVGKTENRPGLCKGA